nr:MAG TPA: hypothetical protein [Caudoviricetes sp.]
MERDILFSWFRLLYFFPSSLQFEGFLLGFDCSIYLRSVPLTSHSREGCFLYIH